MKLPLFVLLCSLPMNAFAQATSDAMAEAIADLAISTVLDAAERQGADVEECPPESGMTFDRPPEFGDPKLWSQYVLFKLCERIR